MDTSTSPERVEPGQVWKDDDPRGGATFRVVDVGNEYAWVTDLQGKRRRKIKLARLKKAGRRGYSRLS